MAYIKWEPGIERKLQQEISRKFRNLKVDVPAKTPQDSDDASDLDDRQRRALLWLDDRADKHGLPAYLDVGAALGIDVKAVADVCRRLEAKAYIEVGKVMGGEENWDVKITDAGRIAAGDIRQLPQRERQRREGERQERRRERWRFFHEKYLAPTIVGIVIGLLVGVTVGWMLRGISAPTAAPHAPATQSAQP